MDDNNAVATALRALVKCDYQRDLVAIRNLTYEILTLATNGSNIKPALPVIVKLLAHPDAFIKRVAGEIVAIHAEENQDITLLGINTLVQDCKDVNPVVKGISFRVLGSLKTNAVSEVLSKAIVGGLEDKNGYVRRSAALASISLNEMSSAAVLDGEIWDRLYQHLRDDDPATVASCLCALEEVCAKEKGIVMSNKLGKYLISKIDSFSPTVQRIVIQFLLKFSPKTKDEMFDHLNCLDDNLTKAHCFAVVFSAYELFHHFTQDVPRTQRKLVNSAWTSIKANLARERSDELISAAIHYINSVNFSLENFSSDFNRFLCRDDDGLYLSHQKITVLSKLMTLDNVDKIFSEHLSNVRTMGLNDVRHLVQNVSTILDEKPDLSRPCVDFLKNLLATDKAEIVTEVVQILPVISLREEELWKDVLALIEEKCHHITSLEAKTAMLQMIKTHPSEFENAAGILEEMCSDFDRSSHRDRLNRKRSESSDLSCPLLKVNLLGALVQVFLLQPGLMQPVLAMYMEQCLKDSDYFVRDKAFMYYGFLSSKVKPEH